MKFYEEVGGSKRNKWFDFGSDLDRHANCPIEIQPLLNTLWADFDEMFNLTLHWSKEQLIIFRVIWIIMLTIQTGHQGNMGVMSYRGLCSLSALVSSWY